MGRIRNTIELAKASWRVLQQDRELLALPVISFFVSALVFGAFIVPALIMSDAFDESSDQGTSPMLYVLLIAGSLALTIVSVFFRGALVSGANERLTGGDPTVSSALSGAFSKLHRLVPWAIVTATVGMVLQAIRDRGGLGRFVAGLLDMAWEVLTFLVLPVVIIEDIGPIAGVKRSAELFRRTWGENLAARVGFGLLGFVALIPALVVGGLAIASGVTILAIIGVVAAVLYIAAVVVVLSALGAIFQTALYHYAATETIVPGFEGTSLATSFEAKGSTGGGAGYNGGFAGGS